MFHKHILAAFALALLLGASAVMAADNLPPPGGSDTSKAPQEKKLIQPDDLPGAAIPHLTTNDFLRKVGGADKPVLVQFDAKWCPYCKKLQPILDEMRTQKLGEIDVYKVDIDEETDLTRSYEVSTLPSLIMFYDGRIVGRSDGGIDKKELADWISAVEDDIKESKRKSGQATPL